MLSKIQRIVHDRLYSVIHLPMYSPLATFDSFGLLFSLVSRIHFGMSLPFPSPCSL